MSKRFLKIRRIVALVAVFSLALSLPAAADNSSVKKGDSTLAALSGTSLPVKAGTYDVPGKPHMKLKVFVYKGKPETLGKPAKPAPAPEAQEVCGLSDDNSAVSMVDPTGWKLSGPVSYKINPKSVPASVGGANLAVIAANAFSPWTAVYPYNAINTGTTGASRASLDMSWIIAWGRGDAGALATTYTWYYQATGQVVEIDTIMNKAFPWEWSDPAGWENPVCAYENTYDAQNILTHEIGHWFGLADHYTSAYTEHTMYGYGSKTETKKNTLTTGDLYSLVSLYQ